MEKEELEVEKLRKEIANLDSDLHMKHGRNWKWILTATPIVVAAVATAFQIIVTLDEIKRKARAEIEESNARKQEFLIRSQQLFVDEVLERIVGIRMIRCEPKTEKGGSETQVAHKPDCVSADFEVVEYEVYPGTVQVAAFRSAIAIMNEFPELCAAGRKVLEDNVTWDPDLGALLKNSKCYELPP